MFGFVQKDTIGARKERPAGQQLRHDAAHRPNVDGLIVVHPVEHDFGRPIPTGRHIAGHLRFGGSRQTEIEDLQFAVLVHRNVRGFQVLCIGIVHSVYVSAITRQILLGLTLTR